ncbi:MAG: 6-carboxytetrahydropterin synthase [Bacteroidales bacterium]
MATISITKIFTFEMAHALYGYDGPCANIHGHSYRLEVSIQAKPLEDVNSPKNGMIMDFGDLKRLVQKYILDEVDHALILNANTSAEIIHSLQANYNNIVLYPYQPTSENMLSDFANRIQKQLPSHIQLECLRLYETSTSFAEWKN